MHTLHNSLFSAVIVAIFFIPNALQAQNVGIGINLPTNKLTVNGNTDIRGDLYVNTLQKTADERLTIRSGSDSFGLMHTDGKTAIGTWVGNYGVQGGWIGTFSKDNLVFFTNNGGAQAIIDTNGNAGFGTSTPDKSALVDMSSSSKGMLIPRMTAAQRDAIVAPATGLLVFVINDNSFYYRETNSWKKIGTAGENWSLAGNAGVTGKFLGTTDTAAFRIRTRNQERITIDSSGNVGLGITTPNAALQFSNSLNNRKLVLYQSANNDHQFFGFGVNGGTMRYQVSSPGDHVFYSGSSASTSAELMRIKSTGFVGIGTADPLSKLDIVGSFSQRGGPSFFHPSPDGFYGTMTIGNYPGNTSTEMLYVTSIMPSTLYCVNGIPNNRAAYFGGRVDINGLVTKPAGSFKIDHPLDPENKYLYHSFVESPDMMNIYNGNVTTDNKGEATITMPDWFEALNRDFRYQLTTIGQFAQAMVLTEIKDNQFSIKTDKPHIKVSWMVTGIRHDAFANKNRVPVEEDKTGEEKGRYLQPESFGKPAALGIGRR